MQTDIVERLRERAANRADEFRKVGIDYQMTQFLESEAAETIATLRREVEQARADSAEANHALVDKYRDPKSGMFNFPADVGMIIRRLERERDEARAKALDEADRAVEPFTRRQELLLRCGEMTKPEMRTALAVANGISAAIRSLADKEG